MVPSVEYELNRKMEEAIAEHQARYADDEPQIFQFFRHQKRRPAMPTAHRHPGAVLRQGFSKLTSHSSGISTNRQTIRMGREGSRSRDVTQLPNGRPDQFTVGRSSGYESLDKAAIDAVKQWSFPPAKDGAPICNGLNIPVDFFLAF